LISENEAQVFPAVYNFVHLLARKFQAKFQATNLGCAFPPDAGLTFGKIAEREIRLRGRHG
jgi:hypothetical protein